MAFLRSLMQWLGIAPPLAHVGFRPHRTVDIATSLENARERVLRGIDLVLGGNIRSNEIASDRNACRIDADFGTVNSERVCVTLRRLDDEHTRVEIEAVYPATSTPSTRSAVVDALAEDLART